MTILNNFSVLSNRCMLLLIVLFTIIFGYIIWINISVKFSPENYFLKKFKKIVVNMGSVDFEKLYNSYKLRFITDLGKYKFGMSFLGLTVGSASAEICFDVIEDLEKLKLNNSERRKLYLREFEIYRMLNALRYWTSKYESIKSENRKGPVLKEEDELYIEGILNFISLDLAKSEKKFHNLLSITKNKNYKYVAENNLSVIAEYSNNLTERIDYAYKSFGKGEMLQGIDNVSTINLVYHYLDNGDTEKSISLFEKFIESKPKKTLSQKLEVADEQMMFYKQLGNLDQMKQIMEGLFDEYQKLESTFDAKQKYLLLIALLRISFNYHMLFDKLWIELKNNDANLLKLDFRFVMLLTNSIREIAQKAADKKISEEACEILDRCIIRIDELDIDKQISKLRNEDVVTKREYLKFKSKFELLKLSDDTSLDDYLAAQKRMLRILDELILFDKHQYSAFNTLDSLFIKLDEILSSRDTLSFHFSVSNSDKIMNELVDDAFSLIRRIKEIIDKAPYAKIFAEYHIRLAHYYCCLNRKEEGCKHLEIFHQSKINPLNYAKWLRDFYEKVRSYCMSNTNHPN